MLAECDIPIFTNGVSRDGVHVMHAYMFLFSFFVVVLLFLHNYSLFVYGVVLNSKTSLTLCTLGNYSCFCCGLLTFFKIVFSGCKMVRIQNVCNHQQTTKVTVSTEILVKFTDLKFHASM